MNGIDVSAVTGIVDWMTVNANPAFKVSFSYIACTDGLNYIDPQRALNSKNAKIAGLKIGYIHSSLMANKPEEEAEYFMKSMAVLPKADLPPAVDISCNKTNLSPDEVEGWIKAFIKAVQKSYPMAVLCSNGPFLDFTLNGGHSLGHIPLWLAHNTADFAPKLPSGWDSHWMHRFTNKGRINGISGEVNLNRMKTSL